MTIRLDRRQFLTVFAAAPLAGIQDEASLHILQGESLDRLRMDFNTSRGKVRLLFVLSPT
jgi:hypothetical protein